MPTKNLLLVWGLTLLVLASGCVSNHQERDSQRVQAYTTLYPLEYFTKRIGGERVQVENLVPVGTDLHEFEPSVRDLAKLAEADLFIYNGADLEPWVEKLNSVIDQQQTKTIETTKSISLLPTEGESEHRDHHEGQQHNRNPHVWLDPQLAKKQAAQIQQGLIQADPQHRALYEQNYRQLAAELDQLDRELQQVVKQRKVNIIVVPHDAFAYLTKRYGLQQIAISGLSSMDEPSPRRLKQVVDTIKKDQLRYVFQEPFGHGRLMKTIQQETGVKVLTLHPLEGRTKQEIANGEDYFSIMRKNKAQLTIALENGE